MWQPPEADPHQPRKEIPPCCSEANAGNPMKKDVTPDARRRLVREIATRALAFNVRAVGDVSFVPTILDKVRIVMGIDMQRTPQADVVAMSVEDFLTLLDRNVTELASFASVPRDYVETWRNYARGDLDAALVDAPQGVRVRGDKIGAGAQSRSLAIRTARDANRVQNDNDGEEADHGWA
jgi:hypothetical protein